MSVDDITCAMMLATYVVGFLALITIMIVKAIPYLKPSYEGEKKMGDEGASPEEEGSEMKLKREIAKRIVVATELMAIEAKKLRESELGSVDLEELRMIEAKVCEAADDLGVF